MGKRVFLFFALTVLLSVKISAQSFTYRTSDKEMCGDPGEIFACTFSFTNTASSPINMFIDRYQKTILPYWNSCYCYNICNSPLRDTITLNIPAFATDMIVVQFKTDSVNPGISSSDFKIYQIGFQNNADSFQLEASTTCNLTMGINEHSVNSNSFQLYPNPTNNNITVSLNDEIIKGIKIYNVLGELKEQLIISDLKKQSIDVNSYDHGIYHIELYTDKNLHQKRFIKN